MENDQQATTVHLQPRPVMDHIGERIYVVFSYSGIVITYGNAISFPREWKQILSIHKNEWRHFFFYRK